MEPKDLEGAYVRPDGWLCNVHGQTIGWRVPDCGRAMLDERGRVIGTITHTGRLYDRTGQFVAEITRRDVRERR